MAGSSPFTLLRSILAALIRREGFLLLLSVLAGFIFFPLPACGAAHAISYLDTQ